MAARSSGISRFLVVLAVASTALPLTPEIASASPSAPVKAPDTIEVTATSSAPPGSAAAAAVINCTVQINDPHKSTHLPTNVNVVGTVKCSASMASISMTVILFNNGRLIGINTKANVGKSSISVNAAANCIPSTYQGKGTATLVFPPGYFPSPQVINVTGNSVPVSC